MENVQGLKLWEAVQPLTPLMTMLSPTLEILSLSDIPGLVELPLSFQNLQNLTNLSITRCTNLETLPTGINLQSLCRLILDGCSRLRTFPDISRNVLDLNLSETAIEEIPRCIENFYRLESLFMVSGSKLKHVSFSTLKHLRVADFSNCGALTGPRWNDNASGMDDIEAASSSLPDNFVPKVTLRLLNCFHLDLEPLLQQESVFEQLILSCEEVPSYFTHKTTGSFSSLTIPLLQTSLSQPVFGLRACAKAVFGPIPTFGAVGVCVRVSCRFKDHQGNYFDSPCHEENVTAYKKGTHLFIFDCCFPLTEENAPPAQLNYDHVDIQFHFSDVSLLKEWGIQLLEDCASRTPTTLPNDCEASEDLLVYDECEEAEWEQVFDSTPE